MAEATKPTTLYESRPMLAFGDAGRIVIDDVELQVVDGATTADEVPLRGMRFTWSETKNRAKAGGGTVSQLFLQTDVVCTPGGFPGGAPIRNVSAGGGPGKRW